MQSEKTIEELLRDIHALVPDERKTELGLIEPLKTGLDGFKQFDVSWKVAWRCFERMAAKNVGEQTIKLDDGVSEKYILRYFVRVADSKLLARFDCIINTPGSLFEPSWIRQYGSKALKKLWVDIATLLLGLELQSHKERTILKVKIGYIALERIHEDYDLLLCPGYGSPETGYDFIEMLDKTHKNRIERLKAYVEKENGPYEKDLSSLPWPDVEKGEVRTIWGSIRRS